MMKLFLKNPILFVAVWWTLKTQEGNEHIAYFKNKVKENIFGK